MPKVTQLRWENQIQYCLVPKPLLLTAWHVFIVAFASHNKLLHFKGCKQATKHLMWPAKPKIFTVCPVTEACLPFS